MLPLNTTPSVQATLPHEASALFYEWWNVYQAEPENSQAFFGVCEIIRQALNLEPTYFEGVVMVTLDTTHNALTPTVTLHVDSQMVAQYQAQHVAQNAPIPQQPYVAQAPVQVPQQPQQVEQNYGTAQPVSQPGPVVQQMMQGAPPAMAPIPSVQPLVQQLVQAVPQVQRPAAPRPQSIHVPASQSRQMGGAHTEMGLGNVHSEPGPGNETIPVSGIRGHAMNVAPNRS